MNKGEGQDLTDLVMVKGIKNTEKGMVRTGDPVITTGTNALNINATRVLLR